MPFLNLAAAFFALTIPVVVILYLLKLKRERREISSTILWRRSVEDLLANAPFQKLRRNLLLYLQILILLLAVLALMRPFMRWAGMTDQNMIVLIDRSASMQSTDVEPSRLAVAKAKALQLVDDMSRGDRMAVLAFSDHAQVVQSLTDDQNVLRRTINAIEPSDARTQLVDSLAIAKAIARANKNSEIYIIGDGGLDSKELSLDDLPSVSFIGVAERADNLAIVDLDLREGVGRDRESELFVRVANFSERKRTTTMRLLLDGELVEVKELEMEPGATESKIFRGVSATDGIVEIRIDARDDLAIDNSVRGVLKLKKQYDLMLVTDGTYFLERLLSIHPDFLVTVVRPGSYPPADAEPDLTIFDGWAPEKLTPGNYMMLNAVPPIAGVSASTETLANPIIIDWHRLHPLTRYVNFEPVNIQTALHMQVPSWSRVLAESMDGPMIVLFEDNEIRCLAIAFSIVETDWPLHISFPVFLSNAVRWLASQSGADRRLSHRTGDTVRLVLRGDAEQARIETPNSGDVAVQLDESGGGFFALTERAGIYTMKQGGKQVARFAVNLLSDEESNTTPTEVLSFEGRLLESNPSRLRQNQEIWFWLALAALLVLLLEWFVYCKRSML